MPFPRRLITHPILALVLLIAGFAIVMFASPAGANGGPATVFVDLVVNAQPKSGYVEMTIDGDCMTVAAAELREAGIAVTGDAPIDLMQAGFAPLYAALTQRLYLTVPLTMLPVSRHAGAVRPRNLAQAATGFALNYDAFVQANDTATGLSLWSEQRAFGPLGHVSNTGVARVAISGRGVTTPGYLRYDTRFRHVDTDRALALTAGDFVTGGLAWNRPVRLGGVQLGRNFRSRPDLITTPLPSFAGEAAVPSSVDLFIDGYRQQSQAVEPGRFVLENMPVVSGAGLATIVTTDAVGRQISANIPFYVAPELLRHGLLDFSIELGFVRRGYGLKSFDYGAAVASGFVRRGMSDWITMEMQGEASHRLQTVGLGAVWMPGLLGVMHASVAASRADGKTGTQITAGWRYSARQWSLAAEHRRDSDDFRTLADLDLHGLSRGGTNTRAFASISLDRLGSLGFGLIDVRPRDQLRTQLITGSWSVPFSYGLAMFASADYDVRRGGVSGQLRLSIPLGGGGSSVGLSHDRGRGLVGQVEYSRAAPYSGGLGLAAGIAGDQNGNVYGHGDMTVRTASMQASLGAAVADRRKSAWGGVSGSLVVIDGSMFAASDVSDAFAVVSTGGVANVPVYHENQHVGTTNRGGHVLVPRITPYQAASFTIDPMKLEAGFIPAVVNRRVAVAEGSAVIIDMPIRAMRSATLMLVDAVGAPIAAGSRVQLGNGTFTVVGWDGILYVSDAAEAQTVVVLGADGTQCSADIPASLGLESLRGEVVRCL